MGGNSLNPNEVNLRSRSQSRWTQWLGLALPLVLLLLLFLARAMDSTFVYYPARLISVLNIIFVVLMFLAVAYIAARGYLASGQPQLVWFGGGALVFGLSGLLTAVTQTHLNAAVTLHNTGAFLAALLYAIGAVIGLTAGSSPHRGKVRAYVLTGIYAFGALFMLQVILFSLAALMPTFFIPGTGGTPLRQAVILSATALFAISGILLLFAHFRARTIFVFWYALGLILVALGLFTVGFVKTPGDIFSWLGRGGQYIGSIYLLVATLVVLKESRARATSVGEAMSDAFTPLVAITRRSEVNYRRIVETATEGIWLAQPSGETLFVNQRMADMLGYRPEEMVGRIGLEFLAPEERAAVPETRAKLTTGQKIQKELKFRRKDGTTLWTQVSVSPLLDEQGGHIGNLAMHTDITERKKAESALRANETRLRLILEQLPCNIWTVDKDLNITSVQGEIIRRGARRDTDIIGKSLQEYLQTRDLDSVPIVACRRAIAGERSIYEIESGGKSYITYVEPLRDENGAISGAIAIGIDITERKKAEVIIEHQASLLEVVTDAIISTDKDFVIMSWNKAAEELYGWKAEEVIGKRIAEFLLTEFADGASREESIERFLQDGYWDGEVTYTRKDGSKVDVWAKSIALKDERGNITGGVTLHRDITERKKAEAEKTYLSTFPELNPNPIIELDGDGNVTYMNPAAVRLFPDVLAMGSYLTGVMSLFEGEPASIPARDIPVGDSWYLQIISRVPATQNLRVYGRDITERKKAEQALAETARRLTEAQRISRLGSWEWDIPTGKLHASEETYRIYGVSPEAFPTVDSLVTIVHPDDREKAAGAMKEAVLEGKPTNLEERIILPDGTVHFVYIQGEVTAFDGSGKPLRMVGTVHDITERKQAELLKDDFIGMVSHELRTPLTVFLGAVEVARSQGITPEQIQELLKDASHSAESMAHLVDNLVELSRYQANKLTLERKLLDITRVIRDVAEKEKSHIQNHRLLLDIAEGLPLVEADPLKVGQVLLNLLDNAGKYSPANTEIRVSVKKDGDYLSIGVSDQGKGISPDEQAKIFQPFERLAETSVTKPGLGLGLLVCRRLVQVQGGTIWVESEAGKGSTFRFTIPLHKT
ncbi:MAG: PAS domain S-box protein [Chloroflexi bacterium]|nr:PAS domain S-box protein [Chloroflexota bacterium]